MFLNNCMYRAYIFFLLCVRAGDQDAGSRDRHLRDLLGAYPGLQRADGLPGAGAP